MSERLEVFSDSSHRDSGVPTRPSRPGSQSMVAPIDESTKSLDVGLSDRLQTRSNYGAVVDPASVDVIPQDSGRDSSRKNRKNRSWTDLDIVSWFYNDVSKASEIAKAKSQAQQNAIRNANAAIEFSMKKDRIEAEAVQRASGTVRPTTTGSSIPLPSMLAKHIQPGKQSTTASSIDDFRMNATRNALSTAASDTSGSGEQSPTRMSLLNDNTRQYSVNASTRQSRSDSARTTRDSDYLGFVDGATSIFHTRASGSGKSGIELQSRPSEGERVRLQSTDEMSLDGGGSRGGYGSMDASGAAGA